MVNLKASVVIPSYNSGPGLETCLVALNHQRSALIEQFEVVVVDDGSDDGTEDLVKRLRCDYDLSYVFIPRGPDSGRSAARNVGIRAATGELVVMIDADVVVPPGFLAAHLDYHCRRPDLVVTGPRGSLQEGPVDHHQLRRAFSMDALPPVAGTDSRGPVFRRLSDNMNFLATCWHYMFSCEGGLMPRLAAQLHQPAHDRTAEHRIVLAVHGPLHPPVAPQVRLSLGLCLETRSYREMNRRFYSGAFEFPNKTAVNSPHVVRAVSTWHCPESVRARVLQW